MDFLYGMDSDYISRYCLDSDIENNVCKIVKAYDEILI